MRFVVLASMLLVLSTSGCITCHTYAAFEHARGWRRVADVPVASVSVLGRADGPTLHLHKTYADGATLAGDWEVHAFEDVCLRPESKPCGQGEVARTTSRSTFRIRCRDIDGQPATRELRWDSMGFECREVPDDESLPVHTFSTIEAIRARRVWIRREEESEPARAALLVIALPFAFAADCAWNGLVIGTFVIWAPFINSSAFGAVATWLPFHEGLPELVGE